MGQYCFARWRLLFVVCRLSSSIVVCNADGGWTGRPPGAWAVGQPSVRPSHAGIAAKRLNVRSPKQRRTIAQGRLFFWCRRSRRNSNKVIYNGAPSKGGYVGSNWRFFDPISLYHKKVKIRTYERLIETRIRSIEWRYLQWPRVTPFDILYRLSYLRSGCRYRFQIW